MFEQVVGFIGMLLILFAFIMNQVHKWKSDSFSYDTFNFIGGFLLIVYALLIRSYPFLILNIVWTVVSFRDIVLDVKSVKKTKAAIGHRKR